MKLSDEEQKLLKTICAWWVDVNRNEPDFCHIHKRLHFAQAQLDASKQLDADSMEEVDKAITHYAEECSDSVVSASAISLLVKVTAFFESF